MIRSTSIVLIVLKKPVDVHVVIEYKPGFNDGYESQHLPDINGQGDGKFDCGEDSQGSETQ